MPDAAHAPENARCPECGAEPPQEQIDRAIVHDRLTNTGYLHGDFNFECEECGFGGDGDRWVHGVPVGDFEGGADLWCDPCDTWFMVHRVATTGSHVPDDGVLLHLKCPSCFRFEKINRKGDRRGVHLVGYPPITGKIDDETRPYGWSDEPP